MTVNDIQAVFDAHAANNTKAIVPFLTADFPNREIFNAMLHGLPDAGASVIEIGIPFSDPMADGVVIQRSSEIAIKNGFSFTTLFEDIAAFKAKHPTVPIVLMTYLNPLIHYGFDSFLPTAKQAGVSGLLIVDLPPEHHERLIPDNHDLAMIRLVTPTTQSNRLATIQATGSGFIYYVSVKGVTGTKAPDPIAIQAHLSELTATTHLPTVIGFGIRSVEAAVKMASISDGVVIGSHLIQPFLDSEPSTHAALVDDRLQFIRDIRNAI